ncbi:MAG: response regulator [Candidatus Heimdallarchaeota archaeon]
MATHILIVDDNDDLRGVFRLLLKEYEIVEASNGIEALDCYKESKPSLVLMDVLMPEMDGITATKKILEMDPSAQIIAITAYSTRANEILDAGALDVLKKPIRKVELLKKINEYIIKS